MDTKLSRIASIAEILSGIAVVVTLVILIIGIRENTEVTRAMAYDRNLDAMISERDAIMTNPDLVRLWTDFSLGQANDLDPYEQTQLNLLVNNVFGLYEKAYFNHKYGLMGDQEYTRYERQICVQHAKISRAPKTDTEVRSVITGEFADYMDGLCVDDER